MLRLLTQRLSGTAFHHQNSFYRPLVTCWSHGAPLSTMCQRDSSCLSLLKPQAPLNNRCIFHTSYPRYDLQGKFKKELNYMLSQVDWHEVKSSPKPALTLGASGLIPFVVPPIAIIMNGGFLPNIAAAQLAYGAVILSFLGGVKWGFAVSEGNAPKLTWNNLGLSVSPALIGWLGLILSPWAGNLALIGGLGASAYIDITSPGYPRWFKALRLCLSTIAMGSLGVTFVLRIIL